MFSAFTAGVFLVVTGLIGWNVGRHATFTEGRWHDGPLWWQIALGFGFLLLSVYWARRPIEPDRTSIRTSYRRGTHARHDGTRGGAQSSDERGRLASDETQSSLAASTNVHTDDSR